MPEMIIPVAEQYRSAIHVSDEQRMHVAVHIQADILEPTVAQRKANQWLFMNAGNLVRAEQPQLILDDQLLWRFDIVLTLPDLQTPGHGAIRDLGKLELDAVTGETIVSSTFLQKLQARADAIAYR